MKANQVFQLALCFFLIQGGYSKARKRTTSCTIPEDVRGSWQEEFTGHKKKIRLNVDINEASAKLHMIVGDSPPNADDEEPSSNGSKEEPSSGGNEEEPSSGGSKEEPSSGGSKEEPSSSGSKEEPSSGGSKEEPSSGGSKEEPSSGRSKEEPSSGGSKEEPSSGGSKEEPSSGGSKEEPSSGGSKEEPSSGRSKEEPSSGGSKEEPSSGGSKEEPSSGGSKEEPSSGGSMNTSQVTFDCVSQSDDGYFLTENKVSNETQKRSDIRDSYALKKYACFKFKKEGVSLQIGIYSFQKKPAKIEAKEVCSGMEDKESFHTFHFIPADKPKSSD